MKIEKLAAVLAVQTLWFGFVVTINASPPESDSPPMVALSGVLKSKVEWGPPGFGETPKIDSKVRIFVLKLREPRSAKQLSLSRDKKGEEFREIQLWCDSNAFPKCKSRLRESVGHRITVVGQAARGAEPTDYLPVTLRVSLITSE